MKVLVLGAGVIGTTTAYYLASRGHEVEVIERQNEVAQETSFANGGQLSFSHSEPWATPTVLPKVAKWLLKEDAPLIFRFRLDPWMYFWGLKFLMNCTHAKARYNAANLLRLGMYSKKCINVLQQETGVEFENKKLGILHLHPNQMDLEEAEKQAKFQQSFGCPYELKTWDECRKMEPALEHTERKFVGGIYMPIDESGDVNKFTVNLAKYCQEKLGVKFHFGKEIQEIEDRAGRISWVKAGGQTYTADKYVMALGSFSAVFARRMGFYIPVYPMKGYSITIPLENPKMAPEISITDGEYKVVYCRLGNNLRVAGTAEFAGYNNQIMESRIAPIMRATKGLFPEIGDISKAERWSGLRPTTPEGTPLIGKTKYDNLYLNTGHGTLGWTSCCGSARILADIMEEKTPEILTEGLTLVE